MIKSKCFLHDSKLSRRRVVITLAESIICLFFLFSWIADAAILSEEIHLHDWSYRILGKKYVLIETNKARQLAALEIETSVLVKTKPSELEICLTA